MLNLDRLGYGNWWHENQWRQRSIVPRHRNHLSHMGCEWHVLCWTADVRFFGEIEPQVNLGCVCACRFGHGGVRRRRVVSAIWR